MEKQYLLGLDLGTSAIKGIVVCPDGEIAAQGKVPTNLERPQEGWVEFDAEDHYRSICELIKDLYSQIPQGGQVVALAMAAASGNTLLADEQGNPLTKVINWMDARTKGRTGELLPELDAGGVHKVAGWPFLESFPLAHLAWFKAEMPDEYKNAAHYCMNTDWVLFRLTGKWGMDPSTGTTFYLQDQQKNTWYKPFLDQLGIPEEKLSKLAPSGTILGTLIAKAAQDTGLEPDTKVVLGVFDHPSAARGTGTLKEGELLLSCGTSWVGFYPISDRDLAISQKLLVDPFLQPTGPWGCMFSLPKIGENIDWYIDNLVAGTGDKNKYDTFNIKAQAAPLGANGVVVNPLEEPGRVKKELNDRSSEEISRGVMEGTAFQMRKKLEALAAAGIQATSITMVGGPAESPVWPQIVADVTGLELKLANGQTAGALGAAILAGKGAGIFATEAEGYKKMDIKPVLVKPDRRSQAEYGSIYKERIMSQ
jgi:sugar (pentulose or hexulose) kinase